MADKRLALFIFHLLALHSSAHLLTYNITIPASYEIHGSDAYACTVLELPGDGYKLVGVQPMADQQTVHHILLFGCATPFVSPSVDNPNPAWNCKGHPTCAQGAETIMYGWGRNAATLDLPEGVGFSVGGTTSIKYIVAQVHYLGERPATDASGVAIKLFPHAVPHTAGLISFASSFSIPPRQKAYLVPNRCCYSGFQPLTTFAARVHTHALGKAVWMTRSSTNGSGEVLVHRGDPQLPQGFYPVEHHVLHPGDLLQATCEFNSTSRTSVTSAGPTHEHEMCNLYMMVYGTFSHLTMCAGGVFEVDHTSPGQLPQGGTFQPDPYPLWEPPAADAGGQVGAGGPLGDITSVAIGPDGSLWALYRGDRHWNDTTFDGSNRITAKEPIGIDVVVQMDQATGRVIQRFGAGLLYMPHMLTVDRHGNVWVADVGLHQVIKFSPQGQELMRVGKRLQPGSASGQLCKPTQVALLRDGSFFVSDGYCNARLVRFSAAGQQQAVLQVAGAQVVHSVLVDECRDTVFVASRQDGKVHLLSISSGQPTGLVDVSQHGRAWALVAGPYGQAYLLAWELGSSARLVDLQFPERSWDLPGLDEAYPHDVALGAAALGLSGAGERLFALYVAPTCPGCPGLQKLVLVPEGYKMPSEEEMMHDVASSNSSTEHAHGNPGVAGGGHDSSHSGAPTTAAQPSSKTSGHSTEAGVVAGSTPVAVVASDHSDHMHHGHDDMAAAAAAPEEFETIVTEPVDDSVATGASMLVVLILLVVVAAGIISGYYLVHRSQPQQQKYIALSTTLPVSTVPSNGR